MKDMALFNQEDRGIEQDNQSVSPSIDQDKDGIIEDGLGDPAQPESDTGD